MKNKKINLASLKKSLQLFLLCFIVFSSSLFAQTGHWEKLNPPVSPPVRFAHGMAPIGYHKVLLFGGTGDGAGIDKNQNYGDTWLYDYDQNSWIELKPKSSPPFRSFHNMCKLSENIILLYGGMISESKYFNDTWIFNLIDTSWTMLQLDSVPDHLSHFGLSQISENKAILFGGVKFENAEIINDTWLFDFVKGTWEKIKFNKFTDQIPWNREDPVISLIEDKKVILHGGYSYKIINDTWLFNLESLKWNKIITNGMVDSLTSTGDCNLFSTKIIVFGGENNDGVANNTWIFDISDSIWIKLSIDTLPPKRMYTKLVKIDEGKAIMFGGYAYQGGMDDTWLFTSDINGVEEKINISNNFQISPNPAEDFIEISVGSRHALTNTDIRIFNVFGEIVRNPTPTLPKGEGLRIDVSGLPSGVYFVRVGDKLMKFVKI